MPALMVLGASLVLRRGVEQRELPLDAFYRSYHPSHHLNNPAGRLNTTLVALNQPTRIGQATVMPGDVVLAPAAARRRVPRPAGPEARPKSGA